MLGLRGSWGDCISARVMICIYWCARSEREKSFPRSCMVCMGRVMAQGIPNSTKQCAITFLLQDLLCPVWKSCTRALEALKAGIEVHKGEVELQTARESFEETTASWNDFAADAVARD